MHVDELPNALTLDAEGAFHHDGVRVTHPRLVALLHRSIVQLDDGTYVLTTGRDRVPLEVQDTPYFVRTIERADDGSVLLVLSDDMREPLTNGRPFLLDDHARLRVRVKDDRFWAKLLRPAHAAVVDSIAHDGPDIVARPLAGPLVPIVSAPAGIDWQR